MDSDLLGHVIPASEGVGTILHHVHAGQPDEGVLVERRVLDEALDVLLVVVHVGGDVELGLHDAVVEPVDVTVPVVIITIVIGVLVRVVGVDGVDYPLLGEGIDSIPLDLPEVRHAITIGVRVVDVGPVIVVLLDVR